jgi:hypothetical protein
VAWARSGSGATVSERAAVPLSGLNKERTGGILLLLVGMGVVLESRNYGVGSLGNMGSGFVPLALGVLLVLLGLAIGFTSVSAVQSGDGGEGGHGSVDWRGWACILGGMGAFILLGTTLGFVPATFATVFICAIGDRNNSLRDSAILAVVLTIVASLIFHYGLKVQMPLFSWGR